MFFYSENGLLVLYPEFRCSVMDYGLKVYGSRVTATATLGFCTQGTETDNTFLTQAIKVMPEFKMSALKVFKL